MPDRFGDGKRLLGRSTPVTYAVHDIDCAGTQRTWFCHTGIVKGIDRMNANAAIVSIGNELILGHGIDTNSAWLSEQLAAMGIAVARHETLPDVHEAMVATFRRLCDDPTIQFVLITGGLGPTQDDLTRFALAELTGAELVFDPDVYKQIEKRFERFGRQMAPSNRVQAMIPADARVLANAEGTAAGIACDSNDTTLFAMPGVPHEMKPMFDTHVTPLIDRRLESLGVAPSILVSRKIRVFGAGESAIAEKLGDLMARGVEPELNCTVSSGVITLRIDCRAAGKTQARDRIAAVERIITERLGDLIFGYDDQTLPEVVCTMLRERQATLAAAESCTGGLLGAMLTAIPGASDVFNYGWVTYANAAKIDCLGVDADLIVAEGAVSEPVAKAMAAGARRVAGSDYAVGITGIAGPGGAGPDKPVGLVYIAVADKNGTEVSRRVFSGRRQRIRTLSAHAALDLVRHKLLREKG